MRQTLSEEAIKPGHDRAVLELQSVGVLHRPFGVFTAVETDRAHSFGPARSVEDDVGVRRKQILGPEQVLDVLPASRKRQVREEDGRSSSSSSPRSTITTVSIARVVVVRRVGASRVD